MDLRPVKNKKIYEEIIAQIQSLISAGGLRPGDQLPPERELAEKLGVSRASVREAVRVLELMGLVEIRVGEGTFVREISTEALIQPLAAILALERGTFHQVYEVRRVMECACAYLAAERSSPEEIESMAQALLQMERYLEQNILGDEADTRFHLAVAEGSHNPFLVKLMHTISDSLHQVVQSARRKLFETPGNAQKLLEQHRQIFEAVREGRARDAERLMHYHLVFAEGELAKEINSYSPDGVEKAWLDARSSQ